MKIWKRDRTKERKCYPKLVKWNEKVNKCEENLHNSPWCVCILHHRFQQVIVWLPLSRVCSIAAAPHGCPEPDAFWPRKYLKGEYEDRQKVKQIPEQQNPCWQLLKWSTPVLLPHCTQPAQKNITEKAHILSHLLSYSNRIKQQQKQKLTKLDHKYSTQHCPQAPRSHLYDLHHQESTQHSSPAVHPRYRLSTTVMKGSENIKGVPVKSCLQYQTNYR